MKHKPITAAHAPNCACPRCRHLRARELARLRRERATALLCFAAGAAGFIAIPGRAAVTFAARAFGF